MNSLFSKLKISPKSTKTSLTLEYLVILQSSGLPIYSKCWGNFCAVLTVDDTILSGFLSAITSMPKMMNQETELNAIEMGFSKLLFNYTTPTGHIICGGFRREEITKENMVEIDKFFAQVSKFLEYDYKNAVWNNMAEQEKKEFEKEFLTTIIEPWFHTVQSENHSDDMCPFCSNGNTYKGENNSGLKVTFAERISNLYIGIKDKIANDPSFANMKAYAIRVREKVNRRANIDV